MGIKERRERDRNQTRQLILDAAREQFVRDGTVTMRGIADAIEYSPTAIYGHFSDKDALLTELAACDFRAFTGQFSAVPQDMPPRERLVLLGQNYVRFAQENPSQYRHLFMTPKEHVSAHAAPEEDAYTVLISAVEACVAAGAFHPHHSDAETIAQSLWMSLHGACAMHLTMPAGGKVKLLPLAAMANEIIALLMVGLAQPARGAV